MVTENQLAYMRGTGIDPANITPSQLEWLNSPAGEQSIRNWIATAARSGLYQTGQPYPADPNVVVSQPEPYPGYGMVPYTGPVVRTGFPVPDPWAGTGPPSLVGRWDVNGYAGGALIGDWQGWKPPMLPQNGVNGVLLELKDEPPTVSAENIFNIIAKFFGGVAKIPSWVTALITAGVSLLAIWNMIKGGQGGNGVRSNGQADTAIIGPILGGPGVPEPRAGTYYRTWRTTYERRDGRNGYVWFWAMNDGHIVSYDSLSGRAKRWKPKKPVAVIMRGGKMSMQDFVRADRYLDKMARAIAKRSPRLKIQRG